jgi:hypothetical protein
LCVLLKDFKEVRNNLVHEIISKDLTLKEIERFAFEGLKQADILLQETWFRLDWLGDFYLQD